MDTNKYLKIDRSHLTCPIFRKSNCINNVKLLYAKAAHKNRDSFHFNKIRIDKIEIFHAEREVYCVLFTHKNGKMKSVFFGEKVYNELLEEWNLYEREKNIELIINDKSN